MWLLKSSLFGVIFSLAAFIFDIVSYGNTDNPLFIFLAAHQAIGGVLFWLLMIKQANDWKAEKKRMEDRALKHIKDMNTPISNETFLAALSNNLPDLQREVEKQKFK